MKKQKQKTDDKSPSSTFEQLMEKFQFHNDSVQYHAHIAQFIADEIRENHAEQAKQTGYFTEKFFEENNKARSDEQADASEVDEQASESAAALH